MGKKSALVGRGAHCKELASLLRDNAHRHRLHEVFSDFCELAALSISNAVDRSHYDAREARYLQIVGRYESAEVNRFPRMLAVLVDWLECGFADCLGELFMSLELGDHWKGQFFTPYPVSQLMAGITLGDVRPQLERQGFVTISEPACGAGAMVIACADAIHAQGVNYQQVMHVTAVDIDATAVHMAYVQTSLLHIPAILIHGNSLALTEWAHWVTPAHVLGGWDRRLRQARGAVLASEVPELPAVAAAPAPRHRFPQLKGFSMRAANALSTATTQAIVSHARPDVRLIVPAAAANDGAAQIEAALIFKDRVFTAKAALRARRRAFWSYFGPRQDEPLSPEGAQAAFTEQVQCAMDEYLAAVRRVLPVHH